MSPSWCEWGWNFFFEFGIGWIQKMSFLKNHQFRNIPNILMKKYWEFVDIIWIHQIPN